MSGRRYDVHGVLLDVDCDDDAVAEAIDGRLRHFRAADRGAAQISYELRVVADDGEHPLERPAGRSRPVYDPPSGQVLYFEERDELWIDDRDRVHALVSRTRARISARRSACEDVWLLSRPLFTIPLMELLKRHGLYFAHAAGVAADGRAVVLPGSSGSGKSTLSVALARTGWDFMSDDIVLLPGAGEPPIVLAFPDEVDLSEESAGFFEELGLTGAAPPGWPKHRIRPEADMGTSTAARAGVALLAFPTHSPAETSSLEVLDAATALLELVPNVLLTELASTRAHLDALGQLARSCPVYRLVAGRDFDVISKRLKALIAL